ncbi:MAG: 50S ribosomal protein L13 [Fusobacteria bacterium]|nr:50S ribosomal protein L13 [Fusobacteriota bacterium]
MKTYMATPSTIERKWYVVDAQDQTLGRLASEVAIVLRGKHKPQYTPHLDTGDNVIVINADKVKLTGNKASQKMYYRHTGYTGNLKSFTYKEMMEKFPERVIKYAVKGMVPHNKLGRQMLTKLHVYAGSEHPHQAQQPEALEIKG